MPRSSMSLEVPSLSLFSLFGSAGVVSAGAGSVAVQGRGKSGEHQAQTLRFPVRSAAPRRASGQAAGEQCILLLVTVIFLQSYFGCAKFIVF